MQIASWKNIIVNALFISLTLNQGLKKDLGLKGWGGKGRRGVENGKIVRTSGKILATPLVQELSHG